jgi:hypothetical protein
MQRMDGDPTERVLDWRLQVAQLANELKSMSPEARLALLAAVANFVDEDARHLDA